MASELISAVMFAGRFQSDLVQQSLSYFSRQIYPYKEIIIVEEEDCFHGNIPDPVNMRTVSVPCSAPRIAKWNMALEDCRGRYVAVWEPGDWQGADRLQSQRGHLLQKNSAACVARDVACYCPIEGRAWTLEITRLSPLWQRTLFWDRQRVGSQVEEYFGAYMASPDESRANTAVVKVAAPWYLATLQRSSALGHLAAGARWKSVPVASVTQSLGGDREVFAAMRRRLRRRVPSRASQPGPTTGKRIERETVPALTSAQQARVSCLMPTFGRRAFVPLAIQYFLQQDYPERELIIVDDGEDGIEDIVPKDSRIEYVRLRLRRSIGAKRNLACELARGDYLICWDDDDWYGPQRIRYQIAPLLQNQSDATAIVTGYILDLNERQFWRKRSHPSEAVFIQGVNWGTLAWSRKWWNKGLRFPDISLGEDVALQETLRQHGGRIAHLSNPGVYVYVRHGTNTWKFSSDQMLQDGWDRIQRPAFVPEAVLGGHDFLSRATPQAVRISTAESTALAT